MRSYKLVTKRLDRITPAERRRLSYLTLRSDKYNISAMRKDVLQRQKALYRVQLFLIRDAKGIIVAWSSVLPYSEGTAYVYTYVMQAHRRQGLGTRLINRAMNWCNKQGYRPRVISWDVRSSQFFSTMPQEIKVQVADLA